VKLRTTQKQAGRGGWTIWQNVSKLIGRLAVTFMAINMQIEQQQQQREKEREEIA
jgi:hypothetical protein